MAFDSLDCGTIYLLHVLSHGRRSSPQDEIKKEVKRDRCAPEVICIVHCAARGSVSFEPPISLHSPSIPDLRFDGRCGCYVVLVRSIFARRTRVYCGNNVANQAHSEPFHNDTLTTYHALYRQKCVSRLLGELQQVYAQNTVNEAESWRGLVGSTRSILDNRVCQLRPGELISGNLLTENTRWWTRCA